MNPRTLAALAAVVAAQAQAGGEHYNEALAAYKGQLKQDPPELVNTGFIADRAVSAAHRAIRRANGDVAWPGDAGGDINIASPQINGTVRGDVTVVVERGAIRGNVTSVRR